MLSYIYCQCYEDPHCSVRDRNRSIALTREHSAAADPSEGIIDRPRLFDSARRMRAVVVGEGARARRAGIAPARCKNCKRGAPFMNKISSAARGLRLAALAFTFALG